MSFVMHDPSFRCPLVLVPLLLNMDQCPLPFTKGNVLETGQGEKLSS
jgi:hypothetical protein